MNFGKKNCKNLLEEWNNMDVLTNGMHDLLQTCGSSIRTALSRPSSQQDPLNRVNVTSASDIEQQCLALVGSASSSANVSVSLPICASRNVTAAALFKSVLQPMERIFGTIGIGGGGNAASEDNASDVGSEALFSESVSNSVRSQLEIAFPLCPVITPAHLSPITDIVVLHDNDPPPPGYTRLNHSLTGYYSGDLNAVRKTNANRFLPLFVPKRKYELPVFSRAHGSLSTTHTRSHTTFKCTHSNSDRVLVINSFGLQFLAPRMQPLLLH